MTGYDAGLRMNDTHAYMTDVSNVSGMSNVSGSQKVTPEEHIKQRSAREAKKAQLSRFRLIDTEINRLIEERDEWFARATKITADYGPAPRNGGQNKAREGDRLGNIVAKLTELDGLIDRRVDELVDLRLKIEEAIAGMNDPVLQKPAGFQVYKRAEFRADGGAAVLFLAADYEPTHKGAGLP